jgi:predicted transcriptional regulator
VLLREQERGSFSLFVAAVRGCFEVFVRQKFVIYWPNVNANEMKQENNDLARMVSKMTANSILLGRREGTNHVEERGVDGGIILKLILNECYEVFT